MKATTIFLYTERFLELVKAAGDLAEKSSKVDNKKMSQRAEN